MKFEVMWNNEHRVMIQSRRNIVHSDLKLAETFQNWVINIV